MNTHVFKLPSGVECEVQEFIGKHQRILTEQKNKNMAENLNLVLADIIIRVGSENKIDLEFIMGMLACDRKMALVEARQFTLDDDDEFEFSYDYIDSNGDSQESKQAVDLSEGFPHKKLQVIIEEGDSVTVQDADYKEYSDIIKEVEFTLPRSGKLVRINLLDGYGERAGALTSKKNMSSHTALLMRNPCENHPTDNKEKHFIKINLDQLSLKDIAYLRSTIKELEGSVDTEVKFEHPDAENLSKDERYVSIDLLGVIDFFFPSGAI